MILQELDSYYRRKLEESEADVPVRHWSAVKVGWCIVVDLEGRAVGARKLISGEGKDQRDYIQMNVPEHVSRTSGVHPYFLCDTADYFFGYGEKRGNEKLQRSRELHHSVLDSCLDEGAAAVLRFFDREDRDAALDAATRDEMSESTSSFAVFRIDGSSQYVHERPAIKETWSRYCDAHEQEDAVIGQCSVTGEQAILVRLFPLVSGIPGAQSSGASLVSFNSQAYESYSKKQAYVASISKEVAFNAGTALKMLCNDRKHRVRFGDTQVVFWTDKPRGNEDDLLSAMMIDFDGSLFSEDEDDAEDNRLTEMLKESFVRMKKGQSLDEAAFDESTRFFILGLAPNAARLAVRFFEVSTLGEMSRCYGQYLRDVDMVDVETTSPRALLRQTASLGKDENIPSTLVNAYLSAIYSGAPFPQSLYYSVLSRMRADHGSRTKWDMGQRAALIKACLERSRRYRNRIGNQGKRSAEYEGGLDMSLNEERTNRGYVLGRLFAIMELAQKSAIGNLNATITDRYMGSASTTPARVFPQLLRNYQNHESKIRKQNPGRATYFDKAMCAIMDLLDGDAAFPATLDSEEQGEFYVGYYQQTSAYWTKRSDSQAEE